MKILSSLISACLIGSFATNAQPALLWQKSLGGSAFDLCRSFDATVDGGCIITGSSRSSDGDVSGNHGLTDYWVVKLDPFGIIEWQKSLGGSLGDESSAVETTNDGGYIIAGNTQSNDGDISVNHGDRDVWVLKLDHLGNIEWQKSLGGSLYERTRFVRATNDGGYILGCESHSNDGDVSGHHGFTAYPDIWIVKLDQPGNLQWQKSLGGSVRDEIGAIQITGDGGYIVAGTSESTDGDVTGNHGDLDFWVIKLDQNGQIEWQKSLGGSLFEYAESLQVTNDGGYIVAGTSHSNDGDVSGNHGDQDAWVVKLDQLGNIEWQKSLGGSLAERANQVQPMCDGGYILTGESRSNDGDLTDNKGNLDVWVFKLDHNGDLQWQKSLGGSAADSGNGLILTDDGGGILTGITGSNDGDISGNHGLFDFWAAKLDFSRIHMTCPANISVNAAPGTQTAQITFGTPAATSDCFDPGTSLSLMQGLPSGSYFPVGVTNQCFSAQDICGTCNTCCFTITVEASAQPCDVKENGCLKFELLNITQNPAGQKTYRIRVTNNCAGGLIYAAIQLPDGLTAEDPADNSTYAAPSGHAYVVRNPNASPFHSIRFKSQDSNIAGGQSDIFAYTLPAQADPDYIHISARLYPQVYYEAHLNVFDCPVGITPGISDRDQDVKPVFEPGEGFLRVYPNPTANVLYFDLDKWGTQKGVLRLMNAQGRLVQQMEFLGRDNVGSIHLPEYLVDGMYFIAVWGENGVRKVARFMVER